MPYLCAASSPLIGRCHLLVACAWLAGQLLCSAALAGPLPCKADDDGALYVLWKEHRLKVWPHEIEVATPPDAYPPAQVRCYDAPISTYTFKSEPSIWENPTGTPWGGSPRLSQLRFFVLSPSSKARLAGPRAAASVFDRQCHDVRHLRTRDPAVRIEYCELALQSDPSSRRYTFVDYTPAGTPLTVFCKTYRARGVELCDVEYAIDATLIVRYAFSSVRLAPEDVIGIDKALREAFTQRISTID